jgi:hypothetical protein
MNGKPLYTFDHHDMADGMNYATYNSREQNFNPPPG